MQVSRIEIFGFKSFMDRLILPLESGVTGVVGPNGCGKSNIIDALRWVLGETRAKSLRGGVLEDVIFNGTDKLRPLGLAEVSITLRSSETDFFADLVSPELEANLIASDDEEEDEEETESQLGAEESPAETEDLEKEGGEASGRPHLTVISGNLDQESSSQEFTEEEAPLMEEPTAADSTDEPQESAQNTSANGVSPESARMLNRFSWLKSCNEVQVTRRLYRSGESEYFINRIQCRLKDVKELFRAVGLGPRTYTIVAQGEVSRVVTAKSDDRRKILEEAAGVQGFRDKIATAKRRLADTDVNISRIEDILKEVSRQVNSLKRQASKARNRQHLKEEIARMEQAFYREDYLDFSDRLENFTKEFKELSQEEESLGTRLQKEQADEQEARAELLGYDVQGDDLRGQIDSLKEELSRRAQQKSEKKSRLNELAAFKLARETEITRLEERQSLLLERDQQGRARIEGLQEEIKECELKIAQIDARTSAEKLQELAQQLQAYRAQLKEKETQIRSTRDAYISYSSRLKSLDEQLVSASPLNALQETLQKTELQGLSALTSGAKLFVDSLTVPEKYTKAVQAIIAEKEAFLVADEHYEIAGNFIKSLSSSGQDKKKSSALGVLKKGVAEILPQKKEGFSRLIDEIQVSTECTSAALRILDNVYVASTIEEAAEYFKRMGDRAEADTFVTLDGDIITPWSFYSLRHEGGLVQIKAKRDELDGLCQRYENEQSVLEAECQTLNEKVESAQKAHEEALRESQDRQKELRALGDSLGNLKGSLQAEERMLQQASGDKQRVDQQFADARLSIAEFDREQGRVLEEMALLQSGDESEMHEQVRHLNEEYQTLDENRREKLEILSESARIVEGTRSDLDKARSEASRLNLEKQKVELGLEHLRERVVEDYGEDALRSLSLQEGERLQDGQKKVFKLEVEKLKARIVREGEVDPTSIERLEEEKQRLDDLQNQKDDLENAAVTLRKTITRLTEESQRRFVATFEKVQENFSRLVPRLFGGGKGSLELSDPQNPLDSGLEIIARPPGKKLKSIELLSGGEKALCATALIFSLFLVRPSPLCVLDEVDAPLDDANLMRFISVVKEMSSKTQFIMVTHNKQSMAVSDNLVGVTMQQPGASKVISVSLQEAYSQVA